MAMITKVKSPEQMKCNNCGKEESVVELRYCGLKLCAGCYIRFFEKRVVRTIVENFYIEANDNICVGLSGGKDSMVALYLLNKFNNRTGRRARIFALTIDHGIDGYDEILMNNAKSLCQKIGIEQYVFSFKDEIGHTIDEIARIRPGLCNCGVFRRHVLNKKARDLGATKLATGHNLDDEAESVLMNFISGDVRRIMRGDGLVLDQKFVRRIKPLRRCPESEVLVYARLRFPDMDFALTCPYRGGVIRMDVKKMTDQLERSHPGIRFQILESSEKFRQALLGKSVIASEINECELCGEPTSRRICNSCQLRIEINGIVERFPKQIEADARASSVAGMS